MTSGHDYRTQLILASVNRSADPCDDFYAYVCNRWNEAHPIPDDMAGMSPFAEVTIKVEQDLRGISEEEGIKAVRRVLEKNGLGKWPVLHHKESEDIGDLKDIVEKTGLRSLFTVQITKDMGNLTAHVLQAFELLPLVSKQFQALYSELKHAVYGVKKDLPRWMTCVAHLQEIMKNTIGRLYTEKRLTKEAKQELWEMKKRVAYPEMFLSDEYIDKEFSTVGTVRKYEHFVEIMDRFQRVAYEQLLSTLRASVRDSKDEYFSAFTIK
ncbi:hypothetical protein HPB49_021453 [Dermacentor silvarum]|uniref:Uncharacterized protein n=1 Tax=Dermacentor silvarum TaxID=543639 RepID=A0ACB8DL76_DERSI|nr:hypothetical protein HPB49_021453 [Dermacentor silvarum]